MAQEDLARVWILLQERIDTSNIISEIIGHFALSFVGRSPSATHYFSFFVWIKVIFVCPLYPIFNVPGVMSDSQKVEPVLISKS